jgi:hypothetical protein
MMVLFAVDSRAAEPNGEPGSSASEAVANAPLAKAVVGRWRNVESDGFVELTDDGQVVLGTLSGLSFRGTYELRPGGSVLFEIRRPELPEGKTTVVNELTWDGDVMVLRDPAAGSYARYRRLPW